jgi:hypothetical protein
MFPHPPENIFHKESYDELFSEGDKYSDTNYWRANICADEDILKDL